MPTVRRRQTFIVPLDRGHGTKLDPRPTRGPGFFALRAFTALGFTVLFWGTILYLCLTVR